MLSISNARTPSTTTTTDLTIEPFVSTSLAYTFVQHISTDPTHINANIWEENTRMGKSVYFATQWK